MGLRTILSNANACLFVRLPDDIRQRITRHYNYAVALCAVLLILLVLLHFAFGPPYPRTDFMAAPISTHLPYPVAKGVFLLSTAIYDMLVVFGRIGVILGLGTLADIPGFIKDFSPSVAVVISFVGCGAYLSALAAVIVFFAAKFAQRRLAPARAYFAVISFASVVCLIWVGFATCYWYRTTAYSTAIVQIEEASRA